MGVSPFRSTKYKWSVSGYTSHASVDAVLGGYGGLHQPQEDYYSVGTSHQQSFVTAP